MICESKFSFKYFLGVFFQKVSIVILSRPESTYFRTLTTQSTDGEKHTHTHMHTHNPYAKTDIINPLH